MANGSNTLDKIKAQERELVALRKKRANECDHTSGGGVIPIDQYKGIIRDAQKYPATSVIHPDCGTIFDAKTFTEQEMFEAIFRLESAVHQIKVITSGNMKEKNKEELTNVAEYIEYIGTSLIPYYNSMVAALAKNDNPSGRPNRKVGGTGVSSDMFR